VAAGDWLEQLEAQLERQLEAFLASNPAQQALLQEQEARDRQANLVGERSRLQRQAEQQRQRLLELAGEIRGWRQRVDRARAAGADDLAQRAEAHVTELMDQGRRSWNQLGELGQQFNAVENALQELAAAPPSGARNQQAAGKPDQDHDLEKAWAAFEAQQELERMKARGGQAG
jgi:hercynine metabolism protein